MTNIEMLENTLPIAPLIMVIWRHMIKMSVYCVSQDLKRIIAAATGKARRINVIMPFLYESRQQS